MNVEPKNKLYDYDYDLTEELIAEMPSAKRPEARLMRLSRTEGITGHGSFYDVQDFLRAGDVFVLNDTKVIPARLLGARKSGGKAEALLLCEFEDGTWDALLKPSSRISKGDPVFFEGGGESLEAGGLYDSREGSGTSSI